MRSTFAHNGVNSSSIDYFSSRHFLLKTIVAEVSENCSAVSFDCYIQGADLIEMQKNVPNFEIGHSYAS